MSVGEVEEHEVWQNEALERAAARRGEAISVRTPADEVMLREELRAFEDGCLDMVTEMGGDRWGLYTEWMQGWLDFVFKDGPTLGAALRRLYTIARRYRPDAVAHMNGTEIGLMWGQSRAAESYRLQTIFDGLKRAGAAGYRGGGAKREETRAKYAAAANGNQNRAMGKKRKKK
jgi:hypothetical protein